MTNHLGGENSPYLLQHAQNPVDWHPWGLEALEEARLQHKPIFLSIGYAACHWCHVMAHESFEDPETAAIMNENFINIKVDREERPDLDSIYMSATQALTGSGGWPMSVFLTPDLRPFYAGTYFPPVARYNMPSFKELLSSLAKVWQEQPTEIDRVSARVLQHLQSASSASQAQDGINEADLVVVTNALLESYDWGYGGWGGAPKFPQPMLIDFLLRRAASVNPREEQPLKAAQHALQAMARGGMYDVVGGGFARYSTDNFWRVPHFEKMLYDNAQLARTYLHAWQVTRDPFYERVVAGTLDFVLRELTNAEGGFYSSLDADSDGEEGKFYVWRADEIAAAIGDESDIQFFASAYAVNTRGNWEGKTVLQRALDDATLAAQFKLTIAEVAARLERCHERLFADRGRRIRPGTDDKVLTGWNGLALAAFAEAARFLGGERAAGYLEAATRNAAFLLTALRPEGKLRRTWRAGRTGQPAFLEDYAALICGLLELYQADFNVRWFVAAQELAREMITKFADSNGGFFDTPADAERLLLRPKDLQDSATPSGSALASEALLKLAEFTDHREYRALAEQALSQALDPLRRFPTAFGRWLSVADLALRPGKQVALVYEGGADALRDLLAVFNAEFRPAMVVAAGPYPAPREAPALLADRPPKEGKPTAYVCENFTCKLPVNSPEELRQQL